VVARIGVLALQGDVSEHIDAFRSAARAFGSEASLEVLAVRKPAEIPHLDAVAIPGGESTTISRLIDKTGSIHPSLHLKGEYLQPVQAWS